MSNADRQKRYRDAKRNAQRDENVTRVTEEPERNAQPLQPKPDIETRTRPPIPGDDGYVGVCKCIDGEWVVKPDPPAPVASLSDIDLQLRIKSYPGASWVNSPEHKEVLKRRAAQAAGACVAAAPVHERRARAVRGQPSPHTQHRREYGQGPGRRRGAGSGR